MTNNNCIGGAIGQNCSGVGGTSTTATTTTTTLHFTPIPITNDDSTSTTSTTIAERTQQRNDLIVCLRDLTHGKLFLERERAQLTRAYAAIQVREFA